MPALAAGRSYPLPIEAARDCLKRFSPCVAESSDDGQNVARKLIGNGSLNVPPELARFGDVAAIAEQSPIRLPCCQSSLGPLRDQAPLLFGEGRVEVEHERIGVAAEFGDNEWHSLRHQARDEGDIAR